MYKKFENALVCSIMWAARTLCIYAGLFYICDTIMYMNELGYVVYLVILAITAYIEFKDLIIKLSKIFKG